MLYGTPLPTLHPPFPPPTPASTLSGFHFFVYFSSLNIRHAVPGTPDGSLTFNLVFPLYWTFSVCHSFSLSVLLICFSSPPPTLSVCFCIISSVSFTH